MIWHAVGSLLLFLVIAVPVLYLTRDRVKRYDDGRPVDPEQQRREGYRAIVMPGAPLPRLMRAELDDDD
ncbi:MAG: hypothetical protein QJR09_05315 [Micrococcus sp.]|nr:hypothetical protein [Micrococcus sp.]